MSAVFEDPLMRASVLDIGRMYVSKVKRLTKGATQFEEHIRSRSEKPNEAEAVNMEEENHVENQIETTLSDR